MWLLCNVLSALSGVFNKKITNIILRLFNFGLLLLNKMKLKKDYSYDST